MRMGEVWEGEWRKIGQSCHGNVFLNLAHHHVITYNQMMADLIMVSPRTQAFDAWYTVCACA